MTFPILCVWRDLYAEIYGREERTEVTRNPPHVLRRLKFLNFCALRRICVGQTQDLVKEATAFEAKLQVKTIAPVTKACWGGAKNKDMTFLVFR